MKTFLALICCAACAVSGCGNKGALVLPAKLSDLSSQPVAASKPAPR